jgi:hypothetical protein
MLSVCTYSPELLVQICNVTTYHNIISWPCGRYSWPHNVSKVGYVVTLRACWVRCQCLAVASRWWYGYGLSKYSRAAWHVATIRSYSLLTFMMLLAPITNWEPHGMILTGYSYAMRHGMKVQIVTLYRVSHMQRYGVTVCGNGTLCTDRYSVR